VLNLGDLGKEFDCKADAIRDYVRVRSDVGGEYVRAVGRLAGESSTVNQRLPRYSGSRILEGGFIKPFSHNLKTRGEAHAWLDCVMDGVVVGAVDGSQIYPDKGYDVPIGVVQTAGIYNRHTGAGDFGERTRVELITPAQFERARVYAYSSEFVDAHRFRAECEEIKQLLCEHDEIFVLLDGSLILSHIISRIGVIVPVLSCVTGMIGVPQVMVLEISRYLTGMVSSEMPSPFFILISDRG